ncbi:MAG: ATP-binding protein [Thermodesulfobacteriota bacterium]|nr:ATP-binding protein [Thermodesulfobacteriota bacterium]
MIKEKQESITRNLIVSFVFILTGVIAFSVIIHCVVLAAHEKKQLKKKSDELMKNFIQSIELPLWNFDRENLDKIAEAYFISELVSCIIIWEEEKHRILIEKSSIQNTDDLIVNDRAVLHNGQQIGHVTLSITKQHLKKRLKRLISAYLFIGTGLICLVAGLTGILLRIFLKKPFENLSTGMERLSKGDYTYDLNNIRHKEFFLIVDQFKKMTEKIQKREDSLNRAKKYIDDVFNAVDSVFVGVDARGQITHWNKNAQQLTGSDRTDIGGKGFKDVFPLFADKTGLIEKAVNTRLPQIDDKFSVMENAFLKYYSIAVFPLSSEGEDGAVIRINDISQQVHMEEMMIQTEKRISVGGLSAGMAHEINNPLAGIVQNAQVIENRLLLDNLPANVRVAEELGISMEKITAYMDKREIFTLLSLLREAGDRAAKIVDNMLSFSRKSGSGFMYANVKHIVDTTIALASNDYDLKKNYDFKSIEIVKNYPEHLPDIFCDPSKLQQVILNILKNGAHAMMDSVSRKARPCFAVCIRQENKEVVVEIEDNGPGMDEATRKRVFEPFFTTKPQGVGTGLGLSVSYFIIVENHKGSISVESSRLGGAKFVIRLPEKVQV